MFYRQETVEGSNGKNGRALFFLNLFVLRPVGGPHPGGPVRASVEQIAAGGDGDETSAPSNSPSEFNDVLNSHSTPGAGDVSLCASSAGAE